MIYFFFHFKASIRDSIKSWATEQNWVYTSLHTIHHRHGSSTTQSGLLGALWWGKGEFFCPKHSYRCPHFPLLLLSNQPSYFLFPKVLICGHWLKCLISKLCLGTPVTTLFFTSRREPKWKLQSATRSVCLPILQLDRLASPNQSNIIPVSTPATAVHIPSLGQKGGWTSDSPLEINTLKKVMCLAERHTCLSAAASIIKTALGYKSLLFLTLTKHSLCLYLPHPWGKSVMELQKYRKYLVESTRKETTLSRNTVNWTAVKCKKQANAVPDAGRIGRCHGALTDFLAKSQPSVREGAAAAHQQELWLPARPGLWTRSLSAVQCRWPSKLHPLPT